MHISGSTQASLPLIAVFALVLGTVESTSAQSGAEANEWAKWCQEQDGRVDNSSGNLICIPGPVPNGGYTADQQAMLNLAGQFGSAIGTAIRESFQRSAELQQRLIMQRAWEAELARRQANAEYEQLKIRTQNLISEMHDTINTSELGRSGLGTEQLRMRTSDEMFNRGGEDRGVVTQEVPVPSTLDLTEIRAAQNTYFEALDDVNDADQALVEKQTYIQDLHTFLAEAEQQRDRQRFLVSATPVADPGRQAMETKLAELENTVTELKQWDADAAQDLISLRAEADKARTNLRVAETRRAGVSAPSSNR